MSFSFLIVASIGHAVPQSALNKTQMVVVVVVAFQRCVFYLFIGSREIEYPWCPLPLPYHPACDSVHWPGTRPWHYVSVACVPSGLIFTMHSINNRPTPIIQ